MVIITGWDYIKRIIQLKIKLLSVIILLVCHDNCYEPVQHHGMTSIDVLIMSLITRHRGQCTERTNQREDLSVFLY